ncbi:unnamed protein product [Linum tenue]|uniref:Uncharacterized protein n=1 Tax=Linum tenue TaxID=586396 RepID=A0AAV0MJN5_9ROSI|nr:unnamed protein product [Linum tenue]
MATMVEENSTEQTLPEEMQQQQQKPGSSSSNGDKNPSQSQVWMTMAQAWLSAFPDAKAVSTADVEAWIDSNYSSLPTDLQSMPRSEIIHRLLSIQNYMRPSPQGFKNVIETDCYNSPPIALASQGNKFMFWKTGLELFRWPVAVVKPVDISSDIPSYRFQRTDRWLPVYSWLETLDSDEVVKSKEIYDWLDSNPDIKEDLFSRHSRYHLMHYIKKCHFKILKKRDKKKESQQADKPISPNAHNSIVEFKEPPAPPATISKQLISIPKDSDLYAAKRNEAVQKYEILLELEKKLTPHFSKRQKLQ